MVAAAVIGAQVAGTAISSSANDKASKRAQKTAEANNALQKAEFDQTQANLQPYIKRGSQAGDALNAFLGLGGDEAASQKAFDNYLNSVGYQFQLDQGVNAINSSRATAGLLNSGSTLKALDKYSIGLGGQYANTYANQLSGVSAQGAGAAGDLGRFASAYAGDVGANNNAATAAQNNATVANANNLNSLISAGLGAFGNTRGASSYQASAAPGPTAMDAQLWKT